MVDSVEVRVLLGVVDFVYCFVDSIMVWVLLSDTEPTSLVEYSVDSVGVGVLISNAELTFADSIVVGVLLSENDLTSLVDVVEVLLSDVVEVLLSDREPARLVDSIRVVEREVCITMLFGPVLMKIAMANYF